MINLLSIWWLYGNQLCDKYYSMHSKWYWYYYQISQQLSADKQTICVRIENLNDFCACRARLVETLFLFSLTPLLFAMNYMIDALIFAVGKQTESNTQLVHHTVKFSNWTMCLLVFSYFCEEKKTFFSKTSYENFGTLSAFKW